MDNLSSHKVKGVVEAIESVGAEVHFLPPYSPDLNPMSWHSQNSSDCLLRSAKVRASDTLWKTCGKLLDQFGETETLSTQDTAILKMGAL